MKRLFYIFLIGIITFSTIFTLTDFRPKSIPGEDEVASANLYKTSPGLVIDGETDQVWDTTSWVDVSEIVKGTIPYQYDFAAQYKTLFDEKSLYFLVSVTDDVMDNDHGIDFYFEDDSIEFYFDMGNEKSGIPDENDFQYCFVYGKSEIYSREKADTSSIIVS